MLIIAKLRKIFCRKVQWDGSYLVHFSSIHYDIGKDNKKYLFYFALHSAFTIFAEDMQQDKEKQLTALLIADVERYMGRELKSPNDFQRLIDILPKDEKLSVSTLKRLWQYVPNEHKTREATLNILSKLLGYKNWLDYGMAHAIIQESDFLTGINTQRDIAVGSVIMLQWEPDRECLIKKTESGRFLVTEAKNTKLQVGDEFFTAWLAKGKPLLATQFTRNKILQPDYIAGRRNGLTSIILYNAPDNPTIEPTSPKLS